METKRDAKPFGYISDDAVRAVTKRGPEGAVRPCSFKIRAHAHGTSIVPIYLAAPDVDQLTADNAALRADLSDARSNWESGAEELRQADLVREQLVAALKEARRAIGDHHVPDHCYSTGPATGDPVRDLVQCPACSAIAMHDDALKAVGRPVQQLASRAAVDNSVPQGFIDYVQANYNGVVDIHRPEWHAKRLWNAAMRHVSPTAVGASDLLGDQRDAARYRWIRNDWIRKDVMNRWVPRHPVAQPDGGAMWYGVSSANTYDQSVDRAMRPTANGAAVQEGGVTP